jgi:hypothetical protein
MAEGELVFKDGSFVRGSYKISQIGTGLKQLTFATRDYSNNSFKETDYLRSLNGRTITTGLVKKNLNYSGGIITIECKFIDKT